MTAIADTCTELLALAEEELAVVLDGRVADDPTVLDQLAARREPLTATLLAAVAATGTLDAAAQESLRRAVDLQAAVTRALADAARTVASELRGIGDGRAAAAAYARA